MLWCLSSSERSDMTELVEALRSSNTVRLVHSLSVSEKRRSSGTLLGNCGVRGLVKYSK